MSEDEAPTQEYEVEITGTFTTYATVEAKDEDEAHDAALEQVGYLAGSDWNDDRMYTVESTTAVAS